MNDSRKSRKVGELVEPWGPGDPPATKEQVLATLKHYGSCSGSSNWMSPELSHACYLALTEENFKPARPKLCCGSHLGGWAYITPEGTFGNFGDDEEACKAAANKYYAAALCDWAAMVGVEAWEEIVKELK